MDNINITELGAAGVLLVLILDRVFAFIKSYTQKPSTNPEFDILFTGFKDACKDLLGIMTKQAELLTQLGVAVADQRDDIHDLKGDLMLLNEKLDRLSVRVEMLSGSGFGKGT